MLTIQSIYISEKKKIKTNISYKTLYSGRRISREFNISTDKSGTTLRSKAGVVGKQTDVIFVCLKYAVYDL